VTRSVSRHTATVAAAAAAIQAAMHLHQRVPADLLMSSTHAAYKLVDIVVGGTMTSSPARGVFSNVSIQHCVRGQVPDHFNSVMTPVAYTLWQLVSTAICRPRQHVIPCSRIGLYHLVRLAQLLLISINCDVEQTSFRTEKQ